MHWIHLASAILLWVAGMLLMRRSSELPGYSVLTVYSAFAAFIICFGFLEASLWHLDFNTMYTIWAGSGLVLLTIMGVINFREIWGIFRSINPYKVVSFMMILFGIMGLGLNG